MPSIPFLSMPETARLWVFGSSQPVVGREAVALLASAEDFVRGWHAHGVPVVGACDWLHDRFLMIAADEAATGVSGCSVDTLYRCLKAAENEIGVTLLDSSLVFFRGLGGAVQAAPRAEFRAMVAAGEVDHRTIVFDNTVGVVGSIRRGEWERPFRDCWHARAFAVRR